MNDQKTQLIEKIKGAKNVLVTVSANPSVDQLAAAIGLTLILNKLDKHATAVYSGDTPSTIQFLQPDATLEKNTDSLRDFIISLDKAKADKLRYKVEERVVKIFITPYRTSLSDKDLEFSQGDFNVDVVIALGVHHQQDLDSAITAHGRILHDAVVTTINNTPDGDLGSLNWQDLSASSLSEQIASLAVDLGESLLDNQIATGLLTGIVAETGRFRNNKTTPRTMSISAELMAAGANQQLVASELEQKPVPAPSQVTEAETDIQVDSTPSVAAQPAEANQDQPPVAPTPPKPNDGTLEIDHHGSDDTDASSDSNQDNHDQPAVLPEPQAEPEPEVEPEQKPSLIGDVKSGNDPLPEPETSADSTQSEHVSEGPKLVTEPPTLGGMLTANSRPEALDPTTDPMSTTATNTPLLSRDTPTQSLDRLDDSADADQSAPLNNTSDTTGAGIEPSLAALLDDSSSSPITSTPQPSADTADTNQSAPVPPEPALPSLSALDDAPSPTPQTDHDHETLTEIEAEVHHDESTPAPNQPDTTESVESEVDSARQAVEDAIKGLPDAGDTGPIQALNAQPFGEDLRGSDAPIVPVDTMAPVGPSSNPLFGSTPSADLPSLDAPVANGPAPLPAAPDPFAAFAPPQPPVQQPAPTAELLMPLPPAPAAPIDATTSFDQFGSQPSQPGQLSQLGQPTAGLPSTNEPAPLANSPADQPFTMPLPPSITMPPAATTSPSASPNADPQAPPPVPPPMMPPGFVNPNQQQ